MGIVKITRHKRSARKSNSFRPCSSVGKFRNSKLEGIMLSIIGKSYRQALPNKSNFSQTPQIGKRRSTLDPQGNVFRPILKHLTSDSSNHTLDPPREPPVPCEEVVAVPPPPTPSVQSVVQSPAWDPRIPHSSWFVASRTSNSVTRLEVKPSTHDFFIAVLLSLYKNFIYLSDAQKDLCIKELKQIMALDLDEQNLYTMYKYKKRRVSKANVQHNLMYESTIQNTEFVKRYLADYWGINIFIVHRQRLECFGDFRPERFSLVLYRNTPSLGLVVEYSPKGWNLWPAEKITTRFKVQLEILKLDLKKMKLAKLQEVAEMYNIDVKKKGKKGFKNKTKSELIEDIQNKFDDDF